MKELLRHLKPYTKECIIAPLFKMIEATFELLVPLVVAYIINHGIKNQDYTSIGICIGLLLAFAIVGYLLHLSKKEKYIGTGKVYITFLLIYGSTRFFLEFLRDNDKLLLGISNLALHALFMVLVGAIWLMVLHEKNKQQEHLKKKNLRR